MIEITAEPIDTQKIIASASKQHAGAVNVFIGTVRSVSSGKNVVRLEYEAYEAMAINEIQKIFDAASGKWNLLGWGFSHRIGVLTPGEAAVVVAIATTHRRESLEATAFVMDELKTKVPIWKKEVHEDGAEWISAHP